ncbi:MAG: hypothetical protein M3160_10845 [Candidatus Eremiobacteraeota bacterium]|nr:hypothetical protein [Candidatus Eremiobacteraeota bacterium]
MRRWHLYAGLSLAVLAVQAALYFAFQQNTVIIISEIILAPAIVLVVTIGVSNDILHGRLTARILVSRSLRRAIPVILIDFVCAIISVSGYGAFSPQSGSPSYGEYWLGTVTLALSGTLLFADVWATLTDGVPWYALVPFAFFRSISLAWQGRTILRILLLVALQVPPVLVSIMLQEWMNAKHFSGSWFFANVPLDTLLAGPFQALFTVTYFDALAREQRLIKR